MSPPIKYGGTFSKSFSWKSGDKLFLGNLLEAVLHGGLMIRSCQEWKSFTSAFASNLKTIDLKVFANHKGI